MFDPAQLSSARSDIAEAINSARRIGAARGGQPQQPGMTPTQPGMPMMQPALQPGQMPMMQPGVPMPQPGQPQMPQQQAMPQQQPGQSMQPMGMPPGQQSWMAQLPPMVQQMLQQRVQQMAGGNPGPMNTHFAGLASRYGVGGGPQQQAQSTGPLGALMASSSGPQGG